METYYGLFIAGIVFCSLGYLLALSALVFNIKFMKLRFIKMTSPRVNIFLVVGTLTIYTSILLMVLPMDTWAMDIKIQLVQCRYWLLTLGFTITFGSMVVKGWRVHRLFQYARTHTVTIKDGTLFGGIAVLLLLDCGLLTSWQAIDPIYCEDSHMNSHTCVSEYYPIWMTVLVVYKYSIVVICCYVGWQIRHITFPALDDSRCLLLSSGVTLTLSGAVSIIMILYPNSSIALTALTSICLWIGTTTILLIIFLPKVLVVYRSNGLEPLMCSASKYVQQPVSNDIGTELIKILGENRYLKRKLEERDTLVCHLKKKLHNSMPADTDSQQTSSVNYSVTSTNTTALTPPSPSTSLCQTINCFQTCCDSSDQSVKAEQGSPVSDRDLSEMSIKTVDVLTIPDVQQHVLQSYVHEPTSQCDELDVYKISLAPSTAASYTEHKVTNEVDAIPDITISQVEPGSAHSEDLYVNDINLICNIADTYDLGGDSDTLSYVSNCLYNASVGCGVSSWSLQRRGVFNRQRLRQSAMLSNDQLYPESVSSLRPSTAKPKKRRRRQSVATTSNIYMNEKGKPLII